MTSAAVGATGVREVDEVLLGFTRALRAAGVAVTHDRAREYLGAVTLLGPSEEGTRAAGRATLCSGPDDLLRHDQVFAAYFDHRTGLPRARPRPATSTTRTTLPGADADAGAGGEEEDDTDVVRAAASEVEHLRHRDVAALSAAERARLARMFGTLRPRPPYRRSARHRAWHRGEVDAARTVRASLRRMGEPAMVVRRRRVDKPRRVVLIVDVSGSMSAYADALLRLAHRMTQAMPATVETFTLGTRVTPLTRAMRVRDAERSLVAAGEAVPDWSGGTRLGENLKAFLDRWGRRGTARGAVVVVFSDGWERGDTTVLAEQVERLSRVAHRVVWVNPHRGKAGYEPVQRGVVAVLPHVDDFLAGHSLATFAEVVEVVARA